MSEIQVIRLKRDIAHLGNVFLPKGFYLRSHITEDFPYLDYSNKCYFEETYLNALDPGTKVMRCGITYTIVGISSVQLDGTIFYYLGERADTPKKDCIRQHIGDFTVCQKYWYISDKGEVSFAFLGADKNADKWRSKSANYFISEAQAKEVRDVVLS